MPEIYWPFVGLHFCGRTACRLMANAAYCVKFIRTQINFVGGGGSTSYFNFVPCNRAKTRWLAKWDIS